MQERTAQLQAANQELDAFAYSVSHDLRAPLRAMNGFSEILIEDFGDTLQEGAREYLDHIIRASRRMGALIDGLLQLSRFTRGGNVARHGGVSWRLGSRILSELEKSEPDRRVTWRVEPGLTARGDARMLEAVLINLLGNAWKYTADRPEARISLGMLKPRKRRNRKPGRLVTNNLFRTRQWRRF